jgi:hypothetical protein
MCTQFTTLAESNDFRHVWLCEHGTIHLSWDLVTLYLNLSEFEHLAGEQSKIFQQPVIVSANPQFSVN